MELASAGFLENIWATTKIGIVMLWIGLAAIVGLVVAVRTFRFQRRRGAYWQTGRDRYRSSRGDRNEAVIFTSLIWAGLLGFFAFAMTAILPAYALEQVIAFIKQL